MRRSAWTPTKRMMLRERNTSTELAPDTEQIDFTYHILCSFESLFTNLYAPV